MFQKVKSNKLNYQLIISENKFPIIQIEGVKINNLTHPPFLYKYFSLNNNNINSLIKNELYVAEPNKLNDLFDANLWNIKTTKLDFQTLKSEYPEIFKSTEYHKFKSNKLNYTQKILNTYYATWNARIGILCTTTSPTNQLMWAHYANNAGYILEFDYSNFSMNFTGPYPINYTNKLKKLNITTANLDLGFLTNYLIKHKIWAYENEYRFLVFADKSPTFKSDGQFSYLNNPSVNQDRLVKIPKKCIKSIILGYNFFGRKNLIHKNKNEYKIAFSLDNDSIKINLLNYIVGKGIETQLIMVDIRNYKFEPVKIVITSEPNYIFNIIKQ